MEAPTVVLVWACLELKLLPKVPLASNRLNTLAFLNGCSYARTLFLNRRIASFDDTGKRPNAYDYVLFYQFVQYWQPDREKEKTVASLCEVVSGCKYGKEDFWMTPFLPSSLLLLDHCSGHNRQHLPRHCSPRQVPFERPREGSTIELFYRQHAAKVPHPHDVQERLLRAAFP
jgi:hypothetical protein